MPAVKIIQKEWLANTGDEKLFVFINGFNILLMKQDAFACFILVDRK